MVAVIKNSITTGLKELRAAAVVLSVVIILALLVMRAPAEDLAVVAGVPMLCVFAILRLLTQVTIVPPPKGCDDEELTRPAVAPPLRTTYTVLFAGMMLSIFWSLAFLLSLPGYLALGVSGWMALKGFATMFIFALALLLVIQSLRVTPAMAAKVTNRLWAIEDLVALLG